MVNRGFVVDTHLLRELGDLLVGRDSTAVLELVKNGYDADARVVTIHAGQLDSPESAMFVVADDGNGMTFERFNSAFLRIAGRDKESGQRLSPKFRRAYTGQKGIGRLASQKIAKTLTITSNPDQSVYTNKASGVTAEIDWEEIDRQDQLNELASGLVVKEVAAQDGATTGTWLLLRSLKKRWTNAEIAKFTYEIQSAVPPEYLLGNNAESLNLCDDALFGAPLVRRTDVGDPGFRVELAGDLAVGDDLWGVASSKFNWCVEIDVADGVARFKITPTLAQVKESPLSTAYSFQYGTVPGLAFQARFYVLENASASRGPLKSFVRNDSGIRVYFEGFRVLPYGERGNDWLGIDRDYRGGVRRYTIAVDETNSDLLDVDDKEALVALGNTAYYGAVFLTDAGTQGLESLVNREGFVPGPVFDEIRKIVTDGVRLSVRVRRSLHNISSLEVPGVPEVSNNDGEQPSGLSSTANRREAAVPFNLLSRTVPGSEVREKIRNARSAIAELEVTETGGQGEQTFQVVAEGFRAATSVLRGLESIQPELRTLAGVGLQLGAFIHDVNGMLGSAKTIRQLLSRAIDETENRDLRRRLQITLRSADELAHTLSRQSSFLTDVMTSDSRRRRSRIILQERLDAVVKFLEVPLEKSSIAVRSSIGHALKTPPMFPSEITILLTNLMTNAIKNAGQDGQIWVDCESLSEDRIRVTLSNSGNAIDLEESERWFLPFESTTVGVDEALGQGLGLGLPIVRAIVDDYDGWVQFVPPRHEAATSIEVEIGKFGG